MLLVELGAPMPAVPAPSDSVEVLRIAVDEIRLYGAKAFACGRRDMVVAKVRTWCVLACDELFSRWVTPAISPSLLLFVPVERKERIRDRRGPNRD